MTTLLVQIDGATMPLSSCHWVLFDPTGCASGSEYGDGAVSAEQAHKNFTPRQRDRDKQTRQGWRIDLLTKEQWHEQAGPCFYGTCEHRKAARS
jgi:hypothetical protein